VQRLGVVFARVTQPCQPSPIPLSGRPAHRPFRGLLSVYSRCGLHTRTVTVYRDRYPKASDTSSPPCLLRSLPAGAVAGWGLHPLEKRRLVTAHVDTRPSGLIGQRRGCADSRHPFLCRRFQCCPCRPRSLALDENLARRFWISFSIRIAVFPERPNPACARVRRCVAPQASARHAKSLMMPLSVTARATQPLSLR
jgi:hypothetical protein